jgi:hypothetical protein
MTTTSVSNVARHLKLYSVLLVGHGPSVFGHSCRKNMYSKTGAKLDILRISTEENSSFQCLVRLAVLLEGIAFCAKI